MSNVGTRQTVAKNVFWLSFGQITGRLIRAAVIIYASVYIGLLFLFREPLIHELRTILKSVWGERSP